jgi:hypothetical protein
MSVLIHFTACGAEFPRHDQISPGGQKEKHCVDWIILPGRKNSWQFVKILPKARMAVIL